MLLAPFLVCSPSGSDWRCRDGLPGLQLQPPHSREPTSQNKSASLLVLFP